MSADPAVRLRQLGARAESALLAVLPPARQSPARLHQAMHHAVLGGGKRLRPLLVYAAGLSQGAEESALDAAACAVELIHAYSLVHDDLPAMDDDALRRGRPTVHVAFDEATAILAGDALQALAFEVLATARLDAALKIDMLTQLAQAAGSAGMCGGQAIDIAAVGQSLTLDALREMHACKTGALIRASVRLGALVAGAQAQTLQRLDQYAAALGLAFQIKDDLLDVESDSHTLGKTAGKDAADHKPTYVALLGIDGARAALQAEHRHLHAALDALGGDTALLAALGDLAARRDR